jgi:hypothetical protein
MKFTYKDIYCLMLLYGGIISCPVIKHTGPFTYIEFKVDSKCYSYVFSLSNRGPKQESCSYKPEYLITELGGIYEAGKT